MKYKLFDPPRLTGKYLPQVFASKWLTTGVWNAHLKAYIGWFVGCAPEKVVLAASATAGFQGVLDLVSEWERSGKYPMGVCITDATWPGMVQAIEHANGTIRVKKERADVVVITDVGGRHLIDELPWDVLMGPAMYVHDACHSWTPDPEADFAVMSFYPTKLVPGAEGGAVICKNVADVEPLERWLYCGVRPGQPGEPSVPGRKANMTDVAAALNLEALELAPKYIADIAEAWQVMAAAARGAGIPYREQRTRPYLFQIQAAAPAIVMDRLKKRGVPATWNFPPALLVTLPCHPGMTMLDAKDIMKIVKEEL